MSPDIHALVKRCLAGDEAAWKELVDRFSGLVLTAALDVGLDYDLASDTLQEAFAELHRSLSRIRDPQGLGRWLVVTTRRKAFELANSQGRLLSESKWDLVDSRELADEKMEKLERKAEVRRALAQLGTECQALLRLLFLEEGSTRYEDISRQLGIAVGTIGPRRARCLKRLRESMKELD